MHKPIHRSVAKHRIMFGQVTGLQFTNVIELMATGASLPIIVAVTTLAVNSKIMEPENASIFVSGGALTVAIFPLLASLVGGKNSEKSGEEDPQENAKEL